MLFGFTAEQAFIHELAPNVSYASNGKKNGIM